MRLTTGQWTAVQNHLPQDDAGNALWDKLERRTWGKLGGAVVNIALTKAEQAMVDTARETMSANERRLGSPA